MRFAKDKTPYKTHQGAFVAIGPATGWYVELSARGVRTGAGFYEASSPRLASIRAAIDHDITGPQLEAILAALAAEGWDLGGDVLKTTPRGYAADHPRIDLLRHRSMTIGKSYGFAAGHPHARPARRRPRGLARPAAVRGVGRRARRRVAGQPLRRVLIARSGSQ